MYFKVLGEKDEDLELKTSFNRMDEQTHMFLELLTEPKNIQPDGIFYVIELNYLNVFRE